jgi:hypothetical protein
METAQGISHPSRHAPDQRDYKQNQEDQEQNFGDSGRGDLDSSETENCRDQSNNKKYYRPIKHSTLLQNF